MNAIRPRARRSHHRAAPVAACSDALENSARDLAARIAESLDIRAGANLQVRNASSLSSSDVSRVAESLQSALQARGVQIASFPDAPVSVRVTLSENLTGFIWTAEITQGQNSRVVVLAVARPEQIRSLSSAMPVALHATRFWEARRRR